jgi:predicted ribosomally synthesized peptide with nif11-like leader
MERNMDTTKVIQAVEFLEKATKSEDITKKLEQTKNHQEVIQLAEEHGYTLTRETLAQAMKITVDRSLAEQGIPSWVRARVHAPVHD